MTREEKEQIGKYVLQMARLLEDGCYQQEMLLKAVHIIDEALEQEPTTKNNLGVDAVSRQAVLDLIADYDLSMGQVVRGIHALPSVTPQEPFINKPCVSIGACEHDKNKVLDKIRAEIETKYGQCDICEYFEDYDYEENDISEYRPIGNIADILQIIDKYKAESESEE